jgi:hypothetical protein
VPICAPAPWSPPRYWFWPSFVRSEKGPGSIKGPNFSFNPDWRDS